MVRTVRTASPTGLYHVTSRAVRPMRLFLDASDCAAFRHSLALVHADDPWRLFAYCLMGTHFHLVVRAEPDALAQAMRRVKGWYALELNRRRGRSGPVFRRQLSGKAADDRGARLCRHRVHRREPRSSSSSVTPGGVAVLQPPRARRPRAACSLAGAAERPRLVREPGALPRRSRRGRRAHRRRTSVSSNCLKGGSGQKARPFAGVRPSGLTRSTAVARRESPRRGPGSPSTQFRS
jgi:REP element-mobilizing transposase RayT